MFLRKFLAAIVLLFAASGVFAQVDANTADQAALDGVKGLGPTTSKAILAERARRGKFKDWGDFEDRVKGIGKKKARQLSQAGLQINAQSKPGAPPLPAQRGTPK